MANSKKKFSRLQVGGITFLSVVAIGFFIKFGLSLVEYDAVIGKPARELAKNENELSRLGVTFSENQIDYSKAELVRHFENVKWQKASLNSDETSEIAVQLLADTDLPKALEVQRESSENVPSPTYRDFLQRQNSIATKRATSSIRTYIRESIEENNLEDALKGAELLFLMQDAVIPISSEATALYWFSCNADLVQLLASITESPELNDETRQRILRMVSPDLRIPDLEGIVHRMALEMMLLSKDLDKLEPEEVDALYLFTDGREIPNLSNKQVHAAIQSKLANAWTSIIKKTDFSTEPEIGGFEIDRIIDEHQTFEQEYESDYLVAAIPQKFELFGRMIARILQARAVLNISMGQNLEIGTEVVKMSGYEFEVTVEKDGNNWILRCGNRDFVGRFNNSKGLEINQILGTRYIFER